jgi:hypothetical protein
MRRLMHVKKLHVILEGAKEGHRIYALR